VAETQPQTMTEAEWNALGEKLFGSDLTKWRFRCPHCNNVMSLEKARAMSADKVAKLRAGKWSLEQECIGRYVDEACNWCAYGLFSGPFYVTRDSGAKTPVFGFDIEVTP
jgi:hypothetical protein